MYVFSSHKYFIKFINLCIIVNTLILAQDDFDLQQWEVDMFNISNYVFSSIFLAEMIIKLLALGFKNYFLDKFNAFDFFIVILSCLDIAIS